MSGGRGATISLRPVPLLRPHRHSLLLNYRVWGARPAALRRQTSFCVSDCQKSDFSEFLTDIYMFYRFYLPSPFCVSIPYIFPVPLFLLSHVITPEIQLNRGYMCNLLHAIIACNLLHAINCTCNHGFRGPGKRYKVRSGLEHSPAT